MNLNNPRHRKILLLLMLGSFLGLCCLSMSIFAQDLGIVGATYPIAETDFVTMAQQKIQEKLNHDDIQGWQIQQQEAIRVAADRPVPVEGLGPTIQARQWFWDPSFVIPYDVRSANHAIVIKAGTRFNPLEKHRLKNDLIFFNGDNPEQVAWAQKQNEALKGRVLLILVNGSLHEVQSHFPQKHVYFDQGGKLTQKLQITQIPAIVTQVGSQLEISEVKP
jgi:conjugal transfer pilus assembly protein TraW